MVKLNRRKKYQKMNAQCVIVSVQDTVSPHVPLLFYLRSTDGLKIQIGDVVKVESFQAPLLISEIWKERGMVLTKLQKFNMNTNSIVDDFFIQCDVNFVCVCGMR